MFTVLLEKAEVNVCKTVHCVESERNEQKETSDINTHFLLCNAGFGLKYFFAFGFSNLCMYEWDYNVSQNRPVLGFYSIFLAKYWLSLYCGYGHG